MCGFAGIARRRPEGVDLDTLVPMAGSLGHRGPDGHGYYSGARVGLAHTRLSIIDPAGGAQPMTTPDGSVVLVYNGEIFNFRELRDDLVDRGHCFRTTCDTEVILEAYRAWGPSMVERFNGQFAFALYDRERERLVLARDRFGIRPLYYSVRDRGLYFASEAKALFASGEIDAAVDPVGLNQVFTFWAAMEPQTVFEGIEALEPGTFAMWEDGRLRRERYYSPRFQERDTEPEDAVERLDELLRSSVKLRMRADVPVGSYLSGGLDSTVISTLAAEDSPHQLRSFSVSFDDKSFDESDHQKTAVQSVGSRHRRVQVGADSIAAVFPEVVRHTETPLLRTAPAPLYRLSRLTRDSDIKVVLTGEGADEVFLGYEIFKETAIRRFCLRQPDSSWRPRLFDRLYSYLGNDRARGAMWRKFFLEACGPDEPLFSHVPRFQSTAWAGNFFSEDLKAELADDDPVEDLRSRLPAEYGTWSPLHRAAYLEMRTFLSPYLLSSQADRVSLAHGVEARFPFLDHRLFEFAASLPASSKLRVLEEKHLLRRWARDVVPEELAQRPKQPYRAPDVSSFFGPEMPDYVEEILSPGAVEAAGLFDSNAVQGLVRRCRSGRATTPREGRTLVGILSSQLWHHIFMDGASSLTAASASRSVDPQEADVLIQEDAPDVRPPGGRITAADEGGWT